MSRWYSSLTVLIMIINDVFLIILSSEEVLLQNINIWKTILSIKAISSDVTEAVLLSYDRTTIKWCISQTEISFQIHTSKIL